MVHSGKISSLILWGPPGSGKTTLAKILCDSSYYDLHKLSAINTGVAEKKKILIC